jgi:glycerol-3-phosphate dehydrogenase
MLRDIPFLKQEGLKGGFRYHDASMWDDVLAVQTLKSASEQGAAIANYVEAVEPLWEGERIAGFKARDLEGNADLTVAAKATVICAGPWTDELGRRLSKDWRKWLNPSKGVHLVFDLKRIPIPGALVMSHPEDGRISFVIPRPDFGPGVVIVGTTDSPSPADPEGTQIETSDVSYLMNLMQRYFPDLKLTNSDILSAYVGVRPLFATGEGHALQKVSREHHIGEGPGQTVMVAGGKYTTHRKMGEEIVDFALKQWRRNAKAGLAPAPPRTGASQTKTPVNPKATFEAMKNARHHAQAQGVALPEALLSRYGSDAVAIATHASQSSDPDGFPHLESQLMHAIRAEMVMHLDDFYMRRIPLFAARADHGLPWAQKLAEVWAKERGLPMEAAASELERLKAEIARRSSWVRTIQP